MKTFLICLFFCSAVEARDFKFGYSLINMHTTTNCDWYENKVGNSGRFITNPLYSITYKDTVTFLAGVDSIASPMIGLLYNYRLSKNWFIVGGGYSNNRLDWQGSQADSVRLTYNWGIIPILGLKQDINFLFDSKLSITYTPLIINLSITY